MGIVDLIRYLNRYHCVFFAWLIFLTNIRVLADVYHGEVVEQILFL